MPNHYWIGYAATFSFIWIGYGIYSVVRGDPSSGVILTFGTAFALIICGATWFSRWLLMNYQKLDKKLQKQAGGMNRG